MAMPFGRWSSFEDCVRDLISQGRDEDSARRICGVLMARLEHSGADGQFGLEGTVDLRESNIIYGEAIHPIKTYHPNEWPSIRVYLEDELKRAAETLRGAPLLLDHTHPLNGRVLDAWYEDGAIKYLAELNDEAVLEMIRNGLIRHCSVEYEWGSLERVNGLAPRGIRFTGLALLKDFKPGDPEASVRIWEGIIERLKEYAASGRAVLTPIGESAESQSILGCFLKELREICYERTPAGWRCFSCPQNRRLREVIRRLEALNVYRNLTDGQL